MIYTHIHIYIYNILTSLYLNTKLFYILFVLAPASSSAILGIMMSFPDGGLGKWTGLVLN